MPVDAVFVLPNSAKFTGLSKMDKLSLAKA
jgi:hypothetical protein